MFRHKIKFSGIRSNVQANFSGFFLCFDTQAASNQTTSHNCKLSPITKFGTLRGILIKRTKEKGKSVIKLIPKINVFVV